MGDAEDVVAIEEHWPQALARRDRAWIEQHTADDFVFIRPDGAIVDRATYLARTEAGSDSIVSRANKAEQTRVLGDVAIVIGRLEVGSRDPGGEERQITYRYSTVYVRSGGVWQASTAQVTPMSDSSGT